MGNTWRWTHKVEVIDSLGPVQMRIGLTSLLANHLHDQSHVATQLPRVSNPKAESNLPEEKKTCVCSCAAYTQTDPKDLGFFLQNCPLATCLVVFPLGSDVLVRRLFVPLVDSSLLKINLSIPLLPKIYLPKTVNAL